VEDYFSYKYIYVYIRSFICFTSLLSVVQFNCKYYGTQLYCILYKPFEVLEMSNIIFSTIMHKLIMSSMS